MQEIETKEILEEIARSALQIAFDELKKLNATKLKTQLEQTLLQRAKEGDMSAIKTLLKYQSETETETQKEDANIDMSSFTYEERIKLKKFIENAIKEIRDKPNDEKKHPEAH